MKKTTKPGLDPETKAAEQRMDVADLVRIFEASVKLKVPSTDDLQLRDGTANKLVASMKAGDVTPRQITRLYEAACAIEYGEDNDDKFRAMLGQQLFDIHKLKARQRLEHV